MNDDDEPRRLDLELQHVRVAHACIDLILSHLPHVLIIMPTGRVYGPGELRAALHEMQRRLETPNEAPN